MARRNRSAENPFALGWGVARDGYEWRDGRLYARGRHGYREYRFGLKPGDFGLTAYVDFANISGQGENPESILKFAAEYGDIFKFDGHSTLAMWKHAIKEMWVLYRFQCRIREKSIPEIRRVVDMFTGKARDGRAYRAVQYRFPELQGKKIRGQGLTIVSDRFAWESESFKLYWNDYILSAKEALVREVNQRLEIYTTTPYLTWTADHRPVIGFRPDSLLSCLWLQLAQAIGGRYAHVQCKGPGCTNRIEIGVRGKGRIKEKGTQAATCGHRCRQNYCRAQKRLAEELMRGNPKMPDDEMYRLLCTKGIAGDAWRDKDWVRRVRATLKS